MPESLQAQTLVLGVLATTEDGFPGPGFLLVPAESIPRTYRVRAPRGQASFVLGKAFHQGTSQGDILKFLPTVRRTGRNISFITRASEKDVEIWAHQNRSSARS